MITFKCRECSKRIFVKNQLGGKRIQCPRCYKYLAVPDEKEKNWHLRGIAVFFLASVIFLAVGWIVYFFTNGGWKT